MNSGINNICKISYTKAAAVTSFLASQNSVKITGASWIDFPITSGSKELNIKSTKEASGKTVNVSLVTKLKEIIDDPGLIIIKLETDGGEKIIIGDKDLPVEIEITETLDNKTLNISHKSWRKPLSLIE